VMAPATIVFASSSVMAMIPSVKNVGTF